MEKKEIIINQIIVSMQQYLDREQMKELDSILRINLRGIRLEEECTELSTDVDDNMYILKVFAANKKLEGCKDGTIEQYLRQTKDFLDSVNKNYKNVTKDDVKFYLAMYSRNVKQNTVANAKRFLSSFFSWAHDEGYIRSNPVKTIKGIKPVEVANKHLSLEEEVAVRDVEKSKRDTAIIDFMLSTGVRVGEIEAMNRSNVNLIDGSVTFIGEKNGKQRTVYLDVCAKKHLIEYLQTRTDNDDALFVSHRMFKNVYGIKDVRRLGKTAYENIAKDIAIKAGITDKVCTVHVYRKTFATRLAENGCPLEVVQELLGHSSADITSKHYVAKTKKRVRKEFERCMAA
ncbi:MAG: tyrosine-type recombinase/integrase [Clostridiales bacterium]|nr:tyrosine-type recombinase/integrase [Roseburia sp.]MDD7635304.1 tyrosine-type recombinase/integrase [Clostridiales bacterium]MDY4113972.1 tyrosine-type recombinase/integrase [Roseburia sp.]